MTQSTLQIDASRVTWREVDDEVVALDITRSEYLSLNPSGTVLWRALVAGSTRPELVQLLTDEFEIDVEAATADVEAFVADCVERGLVVER